MKRVFASSLLMSLVAAASSAFAGPIHATFSGSVSGSLAATNILSEFPIGTATSFDVLFDDSGLVANAPVTDLDLAPVSGTVRLGADEWTLTGGYIPSYSYSGTPPNPIVWTQLQLTGSGPTLGGNASLFGLFLTLAPDLSLFNSNSLWVGFGYPIDGGTFYSYVTLDGEFSANRLTSVAEPSTAFLLLPAVFILMRSRRERNARA